MKVLYEDNHLLVVDKPAGMATMGARPGSSSVHAWAADYLKRRYHKPGNVFVGVVHRLDAMSTGVLVLARTSKAASRLGIQFGGPGKSKKASAPAAKLYLALVEGDLRRDPAWSDSGRLEDAVFKDDAAHRMRVDHGEHRRESKPARLRYCVIDSRNTVTLVAVRLLTGRKHQIRLQFADRGHPILGDRKYGARSEFAPGVALHSWQLLITHPTQAVPVRLLSPVPADWQRSFGALPPESTIQSRVRHELDWSPPDDELPDRSTVDD
ncbi:RluA family pseudouridine synthase [Roseiconus nitratireducens]|uniref:RluA family pseudouridine synthase n=1 Tax=Roseiconus nitratireducens TaxID=2605748 RepID=A0A5M6DLF7_9BACT|nr:RluA family pseudouridine synthase [Roseiconus nitratireducens]KAA5547236.1 RluA family pseudouridine synthase [Roseiconus nitratireducens]